MNKIFEINSMEQKRTDSGCSVTFKIVINGHDYDLKYDIFCKDITRVPERCDSVVVSFLMFATRFGLDIHSKLPISKALLYNITKHFLPQLYLCHPKATNKIKLNIPVTDKRFFGKWRGTGVSLGVDSFATIHEYTDDCPYDEYKLTHLVHLKTGAQYGASVSKEYNAETEERLYSIEHSNVIDYCQKYNFELVTIESNLHSIIHAEFEPIFSPTCTFRNLGAVMLVQNYFDKYYYASSYNLDHFKIDVNADSSYYEKWFLSLLSNENITFYSANESMSRTEKVRYISQFSDTYDYLHVCWMNEKNCGHCAKCVRTLVQLDALNVLDKYKKSFDVDYYRANARKYHKLIVARRKRDSFFDEIYHFMKQQGIKLPNALSVMPTRIQLAGNFVVRTYIRPFLGSKKEN